MEVSSVTFCADEIKNVDWNATKTLAADPGAVFQIRKYFEDRGWKEIIRSTTGESFGDPALVYSAPETGSFLPGFCYMTGDQSLMVIDFEVYAVGLGFSWAKDSHGHYRWIEDLIVRLFDRRSAEEYCFF